MDSQLEHVPPQRIVREILHRAAREGITLGRLASQSGLPRAYVASLFACTVRMTDYALSALAGPLHTTADRIKEDALGIVSAR